MPKVTYYIPLPPEMTKEEEAAFVKFVLKFWSERGIEAKMTRVQ